MISSEDIITKLQKRIHSFADSSRPKNIGVVTKNTDGVITASGLSDVAMGEIVQFDNGNKGVALNLDEDSVSLILLGSQENLKEGDRLQTTGKLLGIGVSNDYLGRVVNPLGDPLDGRPPIKADKQMPLERIAPGVIEREPVNTPLKTGIKAIDAMIPIGRGQRELIIGDRGLGKSAIAIDTIINQRSQEKGRKRVVCIYVAIGQKRSTVAQVIDRLKEEQALSYTVVVVADASDSASLQYLAPYAGCAIAEYFMGKGEDVLIVYDDLTKHAWAYRQLSLVLRRPAGREAYPGDVFYLHSRLLERAVKLNKEHSGGSITALPIIETQAGDISAYIPTNVISITDGQIFLEADLFNSGIRPAINVGNSVSRVGGSAQTGAMKSVAGKMRLELAQFQELAAFAQFGSELDKETLKRLERGKRTIEIFKQSQFSPMPESLQVVMIWTVSNGFLDEVPLDSIQRFEEEFTQYLSSRHKKLLEELSSGAKVTPQMAEKMQKAIEDFKKLFSA